MDEDDYEISVYEDDDDDDSSDEMEEMENQLSKQNSLNKTSGKISGYRLIK